MVYFRPYTGASDMVKRKYCFNEEEIESLQSEGCGSGVGRDYLPWILAQQINHFPPYHQTFVSGLALPDLTDLEYFAISPGYQGWFALR